MIKRFCDICETEITKANSLNLDNGGFRMQAEIEGKYSVYGKSKLKVEVITSLDGTANEGDFCKYCILDALYKLDDRPRAMKSS